MLKRLAIVTVVLIAFLSISAAIAAPGLKITRPPVVGPPNTGPSNDPPAEQGQWFQRVDGTREVRHYEFHDNVSTDAGGGFGGGWMSYLAIRGVITTLYFNGAGDIYAFDLYVTITNDMPALSPWLPGANSHNETHTTQEQLRCDMLDVKFTAEFADDGVPGNFPITGPPYFAAVPPLNLPLTLESNIYAKDYDQLAWYCWTPDPYDPKPSDGQYMVPTWDFGDIPLGVSSSRLLAFSLYSPAPPGSALYALLWELHEQEDLLANRTTSLKISDYFDILWPDYGIPYPPDPFTSSDCSVFFNVEEPEPPKIVDVERFANGDINITWLGNAAYLYRVESSTDPYDYNESLMTWVTVANNIPGAAVMNWVDTTPPTAAGTEEYYRIYAKGPCAETRALDTVGAMVIVCRVGRNLVSSMFEPYPPGGGFPGSSTLDKIVGNQFTGGFINFFSDTIEAWDNGLGIYYRCWYDLTNWLDWAGGPPLFGWKADVGYWITILTFNQSKRFVQCGRVSKVNRGIAVASGRNLLGTCFPVSRTIDRMGLISSGFSGSPIQFFSDNVELWNTGTANYDRAWYDTGVPLWKDWTGAPWGRVIVPGDGFWVNVLVFNPPFNWTYPLPPGYN